MGIISEQVQEILRKIPPVRVSQTGVKGGSEGGIYKARRRGGTVEFFEHKEYSPGDDIRSIDWKLYGKREKFYVKEREGEVRLNIYIMIDMSGSMNFEFMGKTKLQEALIIAFSIIYFHLKNQNRIYLLPVSEGKILRTIPIRSEGDFFIWLKNVEEWKGNGADNFTKLEFDPMSYFSSPGRLFIIGDFLEEGIEEFFVKYGSLRLLDITPVAVQVLHPYEISLEYSGRVVLKSMETSEEMEIFPFSMKRRFKREVEKFLAHVKEFVRSRGIFYFLHIAGEDPAGIIVRILSEQWST